MPTHLVRDGGASSGFDVLRARLAELEFLWNAHEGIEDKLIAEAVQRLALVEA